MPRLEIPGIRAINTAKAIETIAIPIEHENHILAAVVRFVTLILLAFLGLVQLQEILFL
jgi:hypothetical protein